MIEDGLTRESWSVDDTVKNWMGRIVHTTREEEEIRLGKVRLGR